MKIIILTVITISVLVLTGYFALNANKNSGNLKTPLANSTPIKLPFEKINAERLKEYADESGFQFKYPQDLKLNKSANLTDKQYSELDLTSDRQPGKIVFEVTASDYSTLADWMNANRSLLKNYKSTKLGELDSIQTAAGNNKLMLIAVDTETLFTLTTEYADNNADFWKNAAAKVAASFAFKPPASPADSSSNTPGGGDVVFEGEEVIE